MKQSFKKIKFAAKKGNYIYLYDNAGIEDFSNKNFNVAFKKGEEFDGDITIDGKPLADKKTFYLPDLSGEDLSQLARLSGGTIPAKPFKEFNFKDICELFPQVRECDVLLLDYAGLDLKPEKGIVIIEINPLIEDRKYTKFYKVLLSGNEYLTTIET